MKCKAWSHAALVAACIVVAQPTHADVEALNRQVVQLYREGKYQEAIELARQSLVEAEATFGPEDPKTATSLNNLALLFQSMGLYDDALPLYRRDLAIRDKALGSDHPDTATSLHNLARLYKVIGHYEDALPLYRSALAIREKNLGPDDASTATSLNDLAGLYRSMGRYNEALPLYRRALAIYEKTVGPAHESTATSVNNLALLFQSMGRYDDALPLSRRALAINEKALGPDHAITATTLSNLAGLYKSMGRFDNALALDRRALSIREKALGPDHPDTAMSLNNLAELYKSMGRYDDALPLHRRALAIKEKVLGPDHASTATSLSNLGGLYESMGRYGEALSLYQRALAIREKALGPDHPDMATSLNNLALLFQSMGRYDDALPLHRRALGIKEKALGPDHPSTATGLNNLAGLYKSMGRYDDALPLLRRALAINEKALGPDHASTASSLNGLAGLYKSMGRNDEAMPLYWRALALHEKALGPDHPYTAIVLNNVAGQYQSLGRIDEVLPLLRRAVRIVAVTDITDPRHEHGALNVLAELSDNLAYVLEQREDPGTLDEAIFYYKLSVNTRQRMRAGTRGLDATTRESFTKTVADPYRALSDLLIQRGRIAEAERVLLLLKESELTEYLRRNGSDGSQLQGLSWTREEEAYRQDLDRVAGQWREFEQRRAAVMDGIKHGRLSDGGPELSELDQRRLQLETQTANVMADATQRFVQASQEANKRREQAFDSARTQLSVKLDELRKRGDGGLRTAGLLLLPSERGLTLIVTTEQGAVPLMRPISEAELDTLVKSLREAIRQRKDYRTPAQALYRHLIEPAEAQLGGANDIQQWAVLPFGNLRALPFAALVRPDGTHLIERYAVAMLTADGTGRLEGLETPGRDTWHGVALGASQPDAEFGSVALPGVRREVCGVIREPTGNDCGSIGGIVAGKRYLDAAFTPELLQRMLGPDSGGAGFLHIATHYKAENSQLLLGDGTKLSTSQMLGWTPRFGQYDLIALSACDSAVSDGALESLGGVLRSRGAKAVLGTLWPVADVGAAPLMVEFYRQRGETRVMSKASALREAQRAMIAGRISDDAGKADLRLPYFWAPYVLMGNWL